MIHPRYDAVLDQAFFGWSELDKRQTLLVSSLSKADESRWLRLLEKFIRLQSVNNAQAPPHALSYFVFGNTAAVIRRVHQGFSDGRTNSHALIGPAELLDASAALALETWNGWETTRPSALQAIPASSLATTADKHAAEQLGPRVGRVEYGLTAALSRFLDDPYRPLTILDCPEEDRLPLVWGLREVAAERVPADLPWTFSTYEDRHDVEGLPHIVFVPVLPKTAAVVRRATVRASQPPTGQYTELANQLVARFLRGTPLPSEAPQEEPVFETDPPFFDTRPADQPEQPLPETRRVPRLAAKRSGHADGLLAADSAESLERELHRLESVWTGPRKRETLRQDLDAEVLSAAARTVEITVREQLFTRLLEATYGPGLDDLEYSSAVQHAIDVVRHCRSEQLAMMLGASAGRRSGDRVRGAAIERWTHGGGVAPTRPTGRGTRVTAAVRETTHTPIVLAVAGIAVLLLVFLLGHLTA